MTAVRRGFTLMEVVITLSIIAIVAAILVPMISNNIRTARLARAQSDVATIGKAIAQFHQDMARWPVNSGATQCAILFSDVDATNDGIPDNSSIPAAWSGVVGARLSLHFNLISNGNGYTVGPSRDGTPAWNGPYLSNMGLDPWGNPYVVNSQWLYSTGGNGVYILSAGAATNADLETGHAGSPPVGSDDISFRVQ